MPQEISATAEEWIVTSQEHASAPTKSTLPNTMSGLPVNMESKPAHTMASDSTNDQAKVKEGKDMLNAGEHGKDNESEVEADNAVEQQTVPRKKKKKRSSKMSKGLGKPTGFEEFYADAPLTPAEALQSRERYDPSKHVDERIQLAVQHFSSRRKFDQHTKDVFDRYLVFGGIDTGPKMFCGTGDADMKYIDAEEIATLRDPTALSAPVLKDEMVVDFEGVLQAFLSSHSSMWFTSEPEDEIKRRVNVIRSFLNYLLYHNVCPEYSDQIYAAKRVCDVGEAQLWLVGESGRKMPGSLNIACSVLFHGWYHSSFICPPGENQPSESDPRIVAAQTTFCAALASHGSDEVCARYKQHNAEHRSQPLRHFRTGLEVTKVELSSKDVRMLYALPMFQSCKPTGRLYARAWHNPACFAKDLTEEEEAAQSTQVHEVPEYEFWLEDDILAKIFNGMKFEAEVYELTFGVWFLDTPSNFRCSFFTWLPNEAMMGWREHVYLPPNKDGPDNESPEAEAGE